MSAVDHSLRLARIDVSRMYRKHTNWRGSGSVVVSVLMYAVLIVGGSLGGGYLGYRGGRAIATGDLGTGTVGGVGGGFTALEAVRGILALFWLLLVLVYVIRTIGQRGTLPRPEGVLTVVPTSQALLGVLLAEYVYFLLWMLVPSIGLGVGLALGTGVVWPAIAVPLAVAAAGVGSVAVSYPLGLAIRHLATRLAFVARHKAGIIVAVFLAYFVALSTGTWNELMVRLFEPMQRSPVGWYADLLFLGTPGLAPSTVRAGGAIALTLAVAPLGTLAGTRVANIHWFSDPALAGADEATSEEDAAPGIERRLESILGTATAALVTLSWRRARRSPLKLLYAFYPLLALAGVFANIVQSGEVPAYLPYAVLVFAAWAAGVIFTLNPLGDQGAALSSTLLSRVDGRTFVVAHLLAGLVVAIPLGTLATVAVAYVSPIDRGTALVLVAAAPVVMVVSAALSVGIGMAFPKFEATKITQSMKTVLPSTWAFLLFSLYLLATAGAAAIVYEPLVADLVAGIVSWLLPFGLGVSSEAVTLVATVALVPLVVAPVLSYRYAIARFDGYTLA
jgi:hypothetical protein